jgi:hypothetical protein
MQSQRFQKCIINPISTKTYHFFKGYSKDLGWQNVEFFKRNQIHSFNESGSLEEEEDLIPNMKHILEYGLKFTNMNNIFKMAGEI